MRNLSLVVLCALAVLVAVVYLTGCSENRNDAVTPASQTQPLVKLSADDPAVKNAMAIQDRHTSDWMQDPNVVGTATTVTPDGQVAIVVYLANDPTPPVKGGVLNGLVPKEIEG